MTLELKNVTLEKQGDTHIYPTELALVAEEFNILLGTTLAGKTTLMRIMAGLEKPSTGEVWFDGIDVTGVSVQKRDVAMVYQQFINYPNFTVYDNIASPMRLMKKDKSAIDRAINEVAELLKLTPMLQRMPNELSGGQQQRTALARALVKQAQLVLLDEPLANLDYKLREELREELPKLFRNSGSTVVYATTEPTEALLLGGYTAALFEGTVLQYGETGLAYRTPASRQSAQVFSDPPINIINVKLANGAIELPGGEQWRARDEIAALPAAEYQLGVRPHHVTLAGGANPYADEFANTTAAVAYDDSADRGIEAISAEVMLTEISGSESTIHASSGDDIWISLNHGIHTLDKGQAIELQIDTRQCLLFDSRGNLVAS